VTERPPRDGAQSPPEPVTEPPPRQAPPDHGEPLDAWPDVEERAEQERERAKGARP
jgi:hypothetical protein